MPGKLSLSLKPKLREHNLMNRRLQRLYTPILARYQKGMQNWLMKNLHTTDSYRGLYLYWIFLMESWYVFLRDQHGTADLRRTIVSGTKRETISFTSSIMALYEKDSELGMLPDTIQALEGGLTVSVGSVASAVNAALVAKARCQSCTNC